MSEAKSETDLCVCIVSNCSRHQSSSSRVAIACDNELSSRKKVFFLIDEIWKIVQPDVAVVTLEKFGDAAWAEPSWLVLFALE